MILSKTKKLFSRSRCLGNHKSTKIRIALKLSHFSGSRSFNFHKVKINMFPTGSKYIFSIKLYNLIACQINTGEKFSVWLFRREIYCPTHLKKVRSFVRNILNRQACTDNGTLLKLTTNGIKRIELQKLYTLRPRPH